MQLVGGYLYGHVLRHVWGAEGGGSEEDESLFFQGVYWQLAERYTSNLPGVYTLV